MHRHIDDLRLELVTADSGADADVAAATGSAGEECMPRVGILPVHREGVADLAGARTVGRQPVEGEAVDEEDERLARRGVEVVDAQRERLADAHIRLVDAPHVRRARGQQQQRKRGEHLARVCTS